MAASSMNESLIAMLPTPGCGQRHNSRLELTMRYQQGLPRRVIEPSMRSSETRKKPWSWAVSTANSLQTYELNAPAEEGGVEVLVIGKVRALEDLERVDDRETAVELAAGDVVVEVLGVSSRSRLCPIQWQI